MLRYVAIAFFLVVLQLLQSSFLPLLGWPGPLNLVLAFFLVAAFFSGKREYPAMIVLALLAGFLLGAFSPIPLVWSMAALLAIYLGFSYGLHVILSQDPRRTTWYFSLAFLVSYVAYALVIAWATEKNTIGDPSWWAWQALFAAGNLALALVIFFFYERLYNPWGKDRQLKLL